jgi:hypothetical protein
LCKGILPRITRIEYYSCPNCYLPGLAVTDNLWVTCGKNRCGRAFRLIDHRITKEEYEEVWGSSIVLETTKDQE